MSIGAGQFKPYFLRQEKTSSGKQQFTERSIANEFFNIDRVLGAWIEGNLAEERIFYALTITNGFDSINRPFDEIDAVPGYAAKLDWNILGAYGYSESDASWSGEPSLVAGLSYGYDAQDRSGRAPDEPKLQVHVFGLDAGFKWKGFSLQAEYMGRLVDIDRYTSGANRFARPADRDAVFSHGFYVQAGIFVVPKELELRGRMSAVFNDEGSLRSDGWESGIGCTYYISGHNLKIASDVMWVDIGPRFPNPTEDLDEAPGAGFDLPLLESPSQGLRLCVQFQLDF